MTVSLGRGPAIKLSAEVGAGLSKNRLLRTGQRGYSLGSIFMLATWKISEPM